MDYEDFIRDLPNELKGFGERLFLFERQDQVGLPPAGGTVFAGSSTITLWERVAEDFPALRVLNRGYGGSTSKLWRLTVDQYLIRYQPGLVFFYCGSNDLAQGAEPPAVVDNLQTIFARIRAALPQTRLVYLGIFPVPSRPAIWESSAWCNERMREWARADSRGAVLDLYSGVLDAKSRIREELFQPDRLHLNRSGYEQVPIPLIRDYLAQIGIG